MSGGPREYVVISILLTAVLVLSGCTNAGSLRYSVYGWITEKDTGIPLAGAEVGMGPAAARTDAEGRYRLEVPEGVHEFQVLLAGYEPYSEEVDLGRSERILVQLEAGLPQMAGQLITVRDLEDNQLGERDTTKHPTAVIRISDYTQLFGGGVQASAFELHLNGQVYSLPFDPTENYLEFPVPLVVGSNAFQLRVLDSNELARSHRPYQVELAWDSVQFRAMLSWDALGDLDLHLFKRSPGEPNVFEGNSLFQHVFWSNPTPSDFGASPEQNPFMDWGYQRQDTTLESITLKELTPGDYHLWIFPYKLKAGLTHAVLQIDLDMTRFAVDRSSFEFELPLEEEDKPIYAITLRVAEDGSRSLVKVDPEVQE